MVVAAMGGIVSAAEYESCFAFDPVFIQSDRRGQPERKTPDPAAEKREQTSAEEQGVAPVRLDLNLATDILK